MVTSTRLPTGDMAAVRALAELKGVSVCALLRELLMPAVHERLRAEVADVGSGARTSNVAAFLSSFGGSPAV